MPHARRASKLACQASMLAACVSPSAARARESRQQKAGQEKSQSGRHSTASVAAGSLRPA
jgi:hypothetical protein